MSDVSDPRGEPDGSSLRVTRLIARDFRNHADLELTPRARFVALVGENGAGKTNLLEALSLFVPGRGLRRAEFAATARSGGPGGFAVSLTLEGHPGAGQFRPAAAQPRRRGAGRAA